LLSCESKTQSEALDEELLLDEDGSAPEVDTVDLLDEQGEELELEEEQSAPLACAERLTLHRNFELAEADPDIQIHASLAFDGDLIWLAYNLPDQEGSSGFDTYLRRLACDGSPVEEALAVHPVSTDNETDPCVAVGPEQALVVWMRDNKAAPRNLDIVYRLFDRDAKALGEPRRLPLMLEGSVLDANAWMPTCAALPDGSFAVAGTVALEGSFRAFVQRLDANGEAQGGLSLADAEAGDFDQRPSLAASEDASLALGFARERGESPSQLYVAQLPAGSSASSIPVELAMPEHFGNSIALSDSAQGLMIGVGTELEGDSSVLVRPLANAELVQTLGRSGRIDHSPALASGADLLGVFYYRVRSGIRNDVVVQGLGYDGTAFQVRPEFVVPTTEPAGPYGAALVHISGRAFFAAWSEGVSPNFRLMGRFVEL
jgi:hypothetical protein